MEKVNVCIIGNGNWATAMGKVVAENAYRLEDVDNRVNMYVYDEVFEGKRISDQINLHHINPKYLPNVKLPENLVAVTDLIETAKYADIILFVIPYNLITDFCKTLLGKIKPSALAISMIKGFMIPEGGGIELITHTVTKYLKIPCAVLAGVNLANEVTSELFCEATIGCRDATPAKLLKDLFIGPYFRIVVIDDSDCVEICALLRNIISFGMGLLDGLDCNENIKSALIRMGLMEMIRFVDIFYPGSKLSTFFESCGISDLITVCYGSRNRRLAEAFVRTESSIEELEADLLHGQKIWGPITAKEVNAMLRQKGVESKFPIFTTIHQICDGLARTYEIVGCLLNSPDHMFVFL